MNNKYRVLLTEVLPYEVPLMFDNNGFYFNMQDDELCNIFSETFKISKNSWTIPFDYSVRRFGGDKSRKLSVIHPFAQLHCVEFYKNYDYYMLSLCNNSPFSIRHIANRAKCVFKAEEVLADDGRELQNRVEVLDGVIGKRYRSYFSYERYDMMYKFFISGDYLRLEQKYSYLMKIDIASCFYHIYTHTIAWAVKGKEQAKDSIGKSTFENDFDSLMQHINYNETNGIIVGPEISRIFAEIILQRIDVNVLNRLKQERCPLKLGRDYEVRRYVDDYYVYANSEDNLRLILEIYKEELQFYKLFINDSKLEFLERPFVSGVSEAKRELSDVVSYISKRWLDRGEDGKYRNVVTNEMKAFTTIANNFRSIAHKYNQKYGTLNRYFLTSLSSQLSKESRNDCHVDVSAGILLLYIEVAFYVFSLDMNVSASIKMCRILDYIHKWAEKCTDNTVLPEIENRIYREAKRCLDIYEVNRKNSETNLEVLNLLLCLSRMMKTPISRPQLINLFDIENGDGYERLNYFQICTLLYIIGNDADYDDIRQNTISEITRRLLLEDALRHADNALLFFDIMVCPYIDKKDVKQVIMKIYNCSENAYGIKYQKLTTTKRWFFNWDKTCDISELISKKEYHSPYE